MELSDLRGQIDEIDAQILDLFTRRMDIARDVAAYKKEHGLPIFQTGREDEILDNVAKKASPDYAGGAKILFTAMMDASKQLQTKVLPPSPYVENLLRSLKRGKQNVSPFIVACQGVPGAFSQKAGQILFPGEKLSFFESFSAVFEAVESSDVAYGILPLENSSAGSVMDVYNLMREYRLYIHSAVKIKVSHCLAAKPGTSIEGIDKVYSHPQALSQSRRFLLSHNLKPCEYQNTAMAAEFVAKSKSPIAAVCSEDCAKLYGLEVLKTDIQDNDENYTRFICISKGLHVSENAETISVYLTLPNTVGSLYRLLARFAILGLNLTKIESRPLGNKAFDACFYLDFTGHIYDPRVQELIGVLEFEMPEFRFLGNFKEYDPENSKG